MRENIFHKALFFSLLIAYPVVYAPYGINETDGGFITGLAWQVLQGKQLYTEVIYVRPPLPIWLRALELRLLPTDWAVLAERVFFYWKIGLAALLAAAALAFGRKKWMLAALGFVVSAHCYPAAAWHTVDGVLFGTVGLWLLFQKPKKRYKSLIVSFLAGVSVAMAMLCKQSFFPLAAVFFTLLALFFWKKKIGQTAVVAAATGFFGAVAAFLFYLKTSGAWSAYFEWTAGAGSLNELLHAGFLDFLRISPKVGGLVLAGFTAGFLVKFFKKETGFRSPFLFSVAALVASYFIQIIENQSFTPPFGQSRLLFDAAIGLVVFDFFANKNRLGAVRLASFLGLSWMSAISWGYNLPILFATPMVFGGWEIWERVNAQRRLLAGTPTSATTPTTATAGFPLLLIALLFTFWTGYQNIYRDGRRAEMTEPMGAVFPKLKGIYSDPETRDRYLELRQLHEKYGTNLVVVPSFPLADFLLETRPVLPLDWEISPETNGRNELIIHILEEKKPVVLLEKTYGDRLLTDPKFAVAKWVLEHFEKKGETVDFWIFGAKN